MEDNNDDDGMGHLYIADHGLADRRSTDHMDLLFKIVRDISSLFDVPLNIFMCMCLFALHL